MKTTLATEALMRTWSPIQFWFSRIGRVCAVVAVIVFTHGCDTAHSPTAPGIPAAEPLLSIVDGSTPTGLQGFYFRPPIVPGPPGGEGEFDASLLDLLAVEICEWTGDTCVMPLVRHITSENAPPEGLRIVRNAGYYRALWDTSRDDLDPTKAYRVRVLASGGELGHADIDIVEGNEPGTDGLVRLENGDGLPIAFRIEEGLGERVGSQATTITLAGGAVELELPDGAVGEDVFITAAPVVDFPPEWPDVVPGTAWDFGPDGLVFDQPVWLTIHYNPANLPPGADENELRIHKLVDGTFVQVDAGVVDVASHAVSAMVDGFSLYVALERLFPGSPEDLEAPIIQSIQVLNQSTGTFGSGTTLELSAADAVLTTRLEITDNISGVQTIELRSLSPSGQQLRWPCYWWPPQDPILGSDTNGTWECTNNWPQYSEAGLWQIAGIWIEDKVGNRGDFWMTPNGLCNGWQANADCVSGTPEITVISSPEDVTPPWVQSFEVSRNEQPRVFGSSATVDAGGGPVPVVFGFQATDDLAGVGPGPHIDWFYVELRGPSDQYTSTYGCNLASGDRWDGSWECHVWIPQGAERGTWRVSRFMVPDRVGNGGWAWEEPFLEDGGGNLCNPSGNCVAAPTVEVTSFGDGQPPEIQSVQLSVVDATVTVTLTVTDDLSGAVIVRPWFYSATTTQDQECYASLVGGDATNGTWQCSFTFSEFAARGQWFMTLWLRDVSGNERNYWRRADGQLCYWDPYPTEVCRDVGVTDIFIE